MELSEYVIESRGQSPFVDVQLKQHATKKFSTRALDSIYALSAHQTAAQSKIQNVARYHVSPDNHICSGGCPGFNYHFAVDYPDGTVYQTNDLTSIVYSSGKAKNYRLDSNADCFDKLGKYFNNYSISVMLRGDFDGPGYKGSQEPTPEQLLGLWKLVYWATQVASFKDNKPLALQNVLGHCHVNKNACPGFEVQDWIENEVWTGKFLEAAKEPMPRPASPLEAATALAGVPLGPTGLGLGAGLGYSLPVLLGLLHRESRSEKNQLSFLGDLLSRPATDD